jgi:hypothetical protein
MQAVLLQRLSSRLSTGTQKKRIKTRQFPSKNKGKITGSHLPTAACSNQISQLTLLLRGICAQVQSQEEFSDTPACQIP